MPLQATSGAASYDAFGGGVPVVPVFIEDVFSTYLYKGNNSTQSIVNGIDLSTKGGLVWFKNRENTNNNFLIDTLRGASNYIRSNQTSAEGNFSPLFSSFNTNGFSLNGTSTDLNSSSYNYVSWTFREQPKFFDVVTWTGNDAASRQIAHNLGSTPGCVIVKATNNTLDWFVSHRSLATANAYLNLNTTAASATGQNWGNSGGTRPTSTDFTVGDNTNISGYTYVAYLFAHDAGGFGLTGTDNVISCGSFTASSGAATVTLGYEPQWIMFKRSDSSTGGNWYMVDIMRGWSFSATAELSANTSNAEDPNAFVANPTATGFSFGTGTLTASGTYIYIAIRRGPMKVPTSGTSVFTPFTRAGNDTQTDVTGVGFTPDLWMVKDRTLAADFPFFDRLRGVTKRVVSNSTNAEETFSGSNGLVSLNMDGITIGAGALDGGICNDTGSNYGNWLLKRAPSFFDEVCYLGNGSTQTITHNLGVVPELIIGKNRTTAGNNWPVLFNFASTTMNYGFLNLTNSCPNDTYANVGVFSAAPTSTSMFLVNSGSMNTNTDKHVAYLFATCAGVSKVGSYTGNGSSQTINCGFTGGARFVMVKATSTTGNWIVADSARGIVAGNDPALYLNSTAAEVTGLDWIDADNSGFVVNETATIAANTNGVSYIFLAIA